MLIRVDICVLTDIMHSNHLWTSACSPTSAGSSGSWWTSFKDNHQISYSGNYESYTNELIHKPAAQGIKFIMIFIVSIFIWLYQ